MKDKFLKLVVYWIFPLTILTLLLFILFLTPKN